MISAQNNPDKGSEESKSPEKNEHDESSFKIEDDEDLTYGNQKQEQLDNYIQYKEVMQDDDEAEEKKQ